MSRNFTDIDQQAVNTMRLLAVDMVEKAKSGHPGMPLGAAPMAYVLFSCFLNYSTKNPNWYNRDRFILSAGHASALLYSWLHLAGYKLSIDDLKNFRQWQSKTPGHPEYGFTAGVEATTGPLGHGFAMGVGMAIKQKVMAEKFNKEDLNILNYKIYALVSDGDLMEGVASEAASLAGTLALDNLVYLYDDNQITIEGKTGISFTEDVRSRFLAYGWQVIVVAKGDNLPLIYQAIENAKLEKDKPTLIMVSTKIGAGSPKEDSPAAHGSPLGAEGTTITKEFYGFDPEQSFFVSEEVKEHFAKISFKNKEKAENWLKIYKEYEKKYSEDYKELERTLNNKLPDDWRTYLPQFAADKAIATRSASGVVLNGLAKRIPELIGGSADLSPSNMTKLDGEESFSEHNRSGKNIHFGVREQAMGAILNGMALGGGLIPFGGTFLVFSDFVRPAVRLSALMKQKVIYIFTHDSIGVGEDGPTHQPIEQLLSLRAIPGLQVIRPADAYETISAWESAIKAGKPSALILSRQNLPVLSPEKYVNVLSGSLKGAYVLAETEGFNKIIIATGSEVSLALAAKELLEADGEKIRVVSMPSWDIFESQNAAYKESVLPKTIKKRLAIEAGRSLGWERYVGTEGKILAIDCFGHSAPAQKVFEHFGFTKENVCNLVKKL